MDEAPMREDVVEYISQTEFNEELIEIVLAPASVRDEENMKFDLQDDIFLNNDAAIDGKMPPKIDERFDTTQEIRLS